jgi:Zn finger protein HypA/HybF involved in hydrogenase expression
MEAYCVKCKAKREMVEAVEVEMKGKGDQKRRAMKGKCPTCGTAMFRILGKAAAETAAPATPAAE